VQAFTPGDPEDLGPLQTALKRYSEAIEPWAKAAVRAMHTQVDLKDLAAWRELSEEMRRGLLDEIRRAPTGAVMRDLMDDQVGLIKSLPTEAAERVQKWTIVGMTDGTRAAEVATAIRDTFGVTQARAMLIARTETSRTAANLQEARAKYVGADTYVWRTVTDADVRPSHRKLEGTVHRWDNPPLCDPPKTRAHPGCVWNCRCFADVIIPDI
jgi:SPP1 gp7 family putative phage head morphogenesis protein